MRGTSYGTVKTLVQTLVAPAPSSPIYDARRTATDRRAVQCSGRCRSRWSSRSPPPSNNCFRGSGVRVQKDFLRSLAGASFSSLQRSARALSRRSRNCDDGRGRRPREGRLVRFLCVCVCPLSSFVQAVESFHLRKNLSTLLANVI